jgi:uncharacterized protein (TIGR03067 family)
MSRFVLLLLAGLSLAFAPAPFLAKKPNPVAAELEALQGEWHLHEYTSGGSPVGCSATYVIAGGRCDVRQKGAVVSRWKVTLDLSASPPAMIWLGKAPNASLGKQIRFRYRRDSDTLRLCWGGLDAPLPAGFTPSKHVIVEVLKRRKP